MKLFDWLQDSNIKKLINDLSYENHKFYFVGGCVRDSFLNEKIQDFDICSNLSPQQNLLHLQKLGYKVISTAINYGCVSLYINGKSFHITTIREDVKTYGRKADVAFVDNLYIDAKRRDFTINAIYLSIDGEIIDYFGGIEDLAQKKVQFIGDANARIQEDYLRILRFFRFSNKLHQFKIDPSLANILKIHSNYLKNISVQRTSQELLKILNTNTSGKIFNLMYNCGILQYLISTSQNNINSLSNFETNNSQYLSFDENHKILVKLAMLLNSTNFKLVLPKKINQNLTQVILLSQFIIKYRVFDYNEIILLIIKYNFFDVKMALIVAKYSNFNTQHIYDKLINKINLKKSQDFPISGDDLLKLNIVGKNIKDTLEHLQKIYWQEPLKSKDEYIEIAKKYNSLV